MFLTTAKYDRRWGYHTSCNLLLDGYNACGWLRASADTQIGQTQVSYACRLYPAYSPLQFDLQDTCSKGFRKGLSVYHFLGHCSAENLAACPGGVVIPSTSLCWKPQDEDESEEGVCWLGEFFRRVSELIQLVHGCTSALADMKDEVGGGTMILSGTLAEVHCAVSGMSAHAFWGTFNGSCPKTKAPGKCKWPAG